jgi:hypothetical protein
MVPVLLYPKRPPTSVVNITDEATGEPCAGYVAVLDAYILNAAADPGIPEKAAVMRSLDNQQAADSCKPVCIGGYLGHFGCIGCAEG